MSYNVMVGKGTRGRFHKALTVHGKAAEPFAKMTAAMVPAGYRAKVIPSN